jgi:hypothetical protein
MKTFVKSLIFFERTFLVIHRSIILNLKRNIYYCHPRECGDPENKAW